MFQKSFPDLSRVTGPRPRLTPGSTSAGQREGHAEGVGGAPARLPRPGEAQTQTEAPTSSVALGGAPQSQKRTPGGPLPGGARIVSSRSTPIGLLVARSWGLNAAVEPC